MKNLLSKRNLTLASSAALSLMSLHSMAKTPDKMNVVLIMADDFGYECVTANGGQSYETPNIDRLAEQGVLYTHCYANPLSTPSRVQLMTGKYNARNYTAFGTLDRGQKTFGHMMKEAGYNTCIAGKWQLGEDKDSPQHFGFDQSCLWHQCEGHYYEGGKKYDSRYANPILEYNGTKKLHTQGEYGPQKACDFVIDFIKENKDNQFFVYYPMILTHCPFMPTPDSKDWTPERSKTYEGRVKHFPDMVKYMDKTVGRVINELERLGLMDNTVVIFTGDNGTDKVVTSQFDGKPYPGGKGKTIDAGIHVPLVVRYPGGVKGVKNEDIIDFTDFLPTVCEIGGVDLSQQKTIDGTSFLPSLVGKEGKTRDWSYCWYNVLKGGDKSKAESKNKAKSKNKKGKKGKKADKKSKKGKKAKKVKEAKVFAHTVQYKLYSTGKFYDVVNDSKEQNPLKLKQLTKEQKSVYKMLNKVIKKYDRNKVFECSK